MTWLHQMERPCRWKEKEYSGSIECCESRRGQHTWRPRPGDMCPWKWVFVDAVMDQSWLIRVGPSGLSMMNFHDPSD